MRLQELFEKHDYHDISRIKLDNQNELKIEFLYDEDNKRPTELLGLYFSKNRDELFIVLEALECDPSELCEKWDEKIAVFIMFGSIDKNILKKFKYNIIQLVLFQDEIKNRSEEGSVKNSRKIFLPFTKDQLGNINIDNNELIEVPFYLIPSSEMKLDNNKVIELNNCIRDFSSEKLKFMLEEHEKVNKRKGQNGITRKIFSINEFKTVEEWLNK